jgi:hypothetical protein
MAHRTQRSGDESPFAATPTQRLRLLYEAESASMSLNVEQALRRRRRLRAIIDELEARGVEVREASIYLAR